MGDLIPIIEGPAKIRDGKKWKTRFACVTRLSPVADSLTLQLWKDRKDWERHPPSKGSIALEEYLGWEAGFTLDRESNTLALILKSDIISLAFDNRETLIRWQVRVTSQFEEGQHFSAHLIQSPNPNNKSKSCPVKIHVQNRRFSLTSGIPLKLFHSWNMNDLRRFGPLEGGRFCFEGGTRCGKGEGIHILRLDDPQDLLRAFEAASSSRLESKRKSMYKCSNNGSFGSHLDHIGITPAQSVLSVASSVRHDTSFGRPESSSRSRSRILMHADSQSSDYNSSGNESTVALLQKRSQSRDEISSRQTTNSSRSLSRCRNPSLNWSSTEGSIETMSIAISEMTEGLNQLGNQHQVMYGNGMPSPDHLVNRKDLLESMGINPGTTNNNKRSHHVQKSSRVSSGEFTPQWSMDLNNDRNSVGSHEDSSIQPNYDVPKHSIPPKEGPPQAPNKKAVGRRMVAATACACDGGQPLNPVAYENYDIPKHISQGELQFYDTPRNLLNDIPVTSVPDSYGNYDTPQQPLPVYRKPCGCIMKLIKLNENNENQQAATTQEQDKLLWAYVQQTPEVVQELSADSMPRVKLTGTGKMPVADMRNSQCGQMSMSSGQLASGQMATGQLSSVQLNGQHLASGHPTVSGLPPKSPLYALVNKASKKKSPPTNNSLPPKKQPFLQTLQHNYCNVSPLLGDVINKKPELFQKVQPNQVFASITRNIDQDNDDQFTKNQEMTQNGQQMTKNDQQMTKNSLQMTKNDNYVEMAPAHVSDDQLPLRPFEPIDYRNRKSVDIDEPVDPISLRLQELHDALEDDTETFADLINPGDFNLSDLGLQDLPPPPPEMLKPVSLCAKYLSQENLPKEESNYALSAVCLPASADCLPVSADCLPAKTNKNNNTTNGFDTMPRAAKISQPSFMRRSSSVPCKTSAQNNRGSTSSSDSGFSPGSPNNATCMQTAAK